MLLSPSPTPSGSTGCVHATLTISHAQCIVVFSHNGIAEVLGLPEYVASTTRSRPHTGLQLTVLNRHRRDEHDQVNLSTQHLPKYQFSPGLNLNIIMNHGILATQK